MDADPSQIPTPTLMRAARGAYARAIRAQLRDMGIDDLPRNSAFILVGIDGQGGPRQDPPSGLGVTEQAMSHAIDILVSRGYLERSPDPDDRRRISLALTGDGHRAVAAVVQGVDAVDRQLLEGVSPEEVEAMRRGLRALAKIKVASVETATGVPRPRRQLRHFSPIFPVRDLAAALAHYGALGFDTLAHEDGAAYGFADRDGIGLHLAADPTHDPARNTLATYLYVRDADALYEEWSRPGIGGRTEPVVLTDYKLREGSHTDPDGNVIRFGSPIED